MVKDLIGRFLRSKKPHKIRKAARIIGSSLEDHSTSLFRWITQTTETLTKFTTEYLI